MEDLLDQDRRQAHARLIQQQDLRASHERAPHSEHLLLTARQSAGILRAALFQDRETAVNVLQICLDPLFVPAQERPHHQIFIYAHAREDPSAFRHLRDAQADDLAGAGLIQRFPLKQDIPA